MHVVTILFMLYVSLGKVLSMRCYNCTTQDTPLCDDPFRADPRLLIDCNSACAKSMMLAHHKKAYERYCGSVTRPSTDTSRCVTQYVPFRGEVTQCYCTSGECNSVSRLQWNYPILLTILLYVQRM